MYNGKRFMALVPARGGSKGIPHKNIALVNNRPLLAYTLDSAKKSKYLDGIYVSTEDEEIAKVAVAEGADIIKRPDFLASDSSKTIDTVIHAVEEAGSEYDYLVLLQPTQPLRTAAHIDEAIETMICRGDSSLVSISPVKNHPLLIRQMDEKGCLKSLLPSSSTVRRQDFEAFYTVNGAIYINKISDLNKDTSLNDNAFGYVMEEQYDLDIDEPFDLYLFEKYLEWNQKS